MASGIWSLSKSRVYVYESETLDGKIHGSSKVEYLILIVCAQRNNDLSDPNLYSSISKEERLLISAEPSFPFMCSRLTNKHAGL